MATLKKVIKVTKAQYNILSSGGRVGNYVGLNDDYLYLIEDNTEYVDITTVDFPNVATYLDWDTTYTLGSVAGQHIRVTMPEAPVYSWSDIPDAPSTFPPSAHNHAASEITSGVLADARIPNLGAGKITSGTFAIDRIPNIPLSKVTGVNTIGTTAASTIAYTTTMSGVTTASPALVSAGAIKQECDYIWASINNINDYCAWQADVDKIDLTVSGNVVTFTNAAGQSVSFTTASAWTDITGKPTLSISGRTVTIGDNSTTWTNTAGLSWDATSHAVKSSVDNTSAVIPTASTSTQGIIAIGTASTQAAAGNHNHDSAYAAKGHTHTTSIATSTGTPSITLSHGAKYALTAGGTTYTFQMPAQYSHPAYAAQTAGLFKIGRDSTGHVVIGDAFTIPTVNNASLTIQKNGTTIKTFTANASTNVTCNITVPTVITDIGGWSSIGTTAVSTKTISTNSASIASGNSDLVTGGAIYNYVENEGGKVKSLTVGSTNYTPTNGVITIPTYPSVSNSTITVKQTGINDQTFTLNGGAITITLADTNTWRPLGTGASDAAAGNHTHSAYVNQNAYGNIKVGSTTTAAGSTTDTVTFAAGGDLNVAINSKTITYSVTLPTTLPASDVSAWAKAATKPTYTLDEVSDGSTRKLSNYLPKISYEYNKEISFGSSGYLKIGRFPVYDSNITIEINSTDSNTYHATVVIATQNVSTSSMGSAHVVSVYGDEKNNVTSSLRVVYVAASRAYDVYFVPAPWSKNLIHIRAMALAAAASDICTSQTGTPPSTTTGLEPVNVLATNYAAKSHSHTAADIGALPTGTTLDSISDGNTRKLSNYLLKTDISDWAKAANKPAYSASEVGALPSTTTYLKSISKSGSTYTITNSANGTTTWTIPTVPTKVSAFTNDAGYLTTVAWGNVTGKPSTFTPTAHTHSISDLTDASTIGTTAVSTTTITTSISSSTTSSKIPTEGAVRAALNNVATTAVVSTITSTSTTGYTDVSITSDGPSKTTTVATSVKAGTASTSVASSNHTHTSTFYYTKTNAATGVNANTTTTAVVKVASFTNGVLTIETVNVASSGHAHTVSTASVVSVVGTTATTNYSSVAMTSGAPSTTTNVSSYNHGHDVNTTSVASSDHTHTGHVYFTKTNVATGVNAGTASVAVASTTHTH